MIPKLPARVQRQIWINGSATDSGVAIPFDAHEVMLGLEAAAFRKVANSVFDGGHDYNELAIGAGILPTWLDGSADRSILVTVSSVDFETWLAELGIVPEDALLMQEDLMSVLREVQATLLSSVGAPSPSTMH